MPDFKLYLEAIALTTNHMNEVDTTGFAKFESIFLSYGQPYGRLTSKNGLHTVIYILPADIATPVIMTYNEKGNKVDSLMLFSKPTSDVGFDAAEKVVIDSTRKIVIIDSTVTWQMNKQESDRIPGSSRLTISFKTFQILPNGRIKRN